jgi:FMN-dependent oxidoreductase (nitrilotriacetate monooxygenase family)
VHPPAWRKPFAKEDDQFGIRYYQELARIAERGLFDGIFFADSLALHQRERRRPLLDAPSMIAALAVSTERIGLVATASTTVNEPYNIARQFMTLDHISGGRVGWNVVTSYHDDAARNFGMAQLPPRQERYERAEEFVDVVLELWESWDYAALSDTSEAGAPGLRHPRVIDHSGRYFSVKGPLQLPLSPQGHPVLFQAGGSEQGKTLAARTATAIFSTALTIPDAKLYYDDVKARALAFGRDASHISILPGVYVYIGSTEREAAELRRSLEEAQTEQEALEQLASRLNIEPERLALDEPVSDELLDRALRTAPGIGHIEAFVRLLRRERLTIRELIDRQPGAAPHRVLVGTPDAIAHSLEEWFLAGAADGFNVGNMTPASLTIFVDNVVPLLQKRGLFRTAYKGSTLRSHYHEANEQEEAVQIRRASA